MKGKKLLIGGAALGLALLMAAGAFAQTVELPFYAEAKSWPNVMFFLDNSGNMNMNINADPEGRKGNEILKDVMVGAGNALVDGSGNFVYIDYDSRHFEIEIAASDTVAYAFATHSITEWIPNESLTPIVRLKQVTDLSGTYFVPDPSGLYFCLIGPSNKDTTDVDWNISKTNFYRLMEEVKVDNPNSEVQVVQVMAPINFPSGGGTTAHVFTAFNLSLPVFSDTFEKGITTIFGFYTSGALAWPLPTLTTLGPHTQGVYVIPVAESPAKSNGVFPDPALGITTYGPWTGSCYKTNGWQPCFVPYPVTSAATLQTKTFLIASDLQFAGLDVAAAEELVNNMVPFETYLSWYAAKYTVTTTPYPWAYYRQKVFSEIWGDMRRSAWNRPDGDGNTPTPLPVYEMCASTDTGRVMLLDPTRSTENKAYINARVIAAIPSTTGVSLYENPPGNAEYPFPDTGEFIITTTGIKLNTKVCPEVDVADLNVFDPNFGGYFDKCKFDKIFQVEPGIMDVYPDINYGFVQFQQDQDCEGADDDFGEDTDGRCVGADLLFNPSSWCDFPKYQGYGLNASICNQQAQEWIRNSWPERVSSSSPISSVMHDMYRYFFPAYHDTEFQSDPGLVPGDLAYTDGCAAPNTPYAEPIFGDAGTTPPPTSQWDFDPRVPTSWLYDLDLDGPSGSENDHIIQDDPYYTGGCRRNYLIFLSGGQQTAGEEGYSNCSGAHPKTWQTDYHWVQMMTQPRHKAGADLTFGNRKEREQYGVKTFIVGFGTKSNTAAVDENTAMALGSDFDGPDLDGDTMNYPLEAENEVELRETLSFILDRIMAGNYTRTAPVVSSQDNAIITSYFDIGEYSLWKGHIVGYSIPGYGEISSSPLWTNIDLGEMLMTQSSRGILTNLENNLNLVSFDSGLANTYMATPGKYFLTYSEDWGTDLDGSKIIAMVRGDSGATFASGAAVTWRLGPVVHSTPRIVSKPNNLLYYYLPGYKTFMTDHVDRPAVMFVGTGYGMLHAFAMSDGHEIFAYIPDTIISALPWLWIGTPIFGMDSTPVFRDLYGNFGGASKEWKTIMMVGMGGGGREYIGMDITNIKASYSSGDVKLLWKYSESQLGNTWSTPLMAMIKGDGLSDGYTVPAGFFGGGIAPGKDAPVPNIGGAFYVLDVSKTGNNLLKKKWHLPGADQITAFSPLTFDMAVNSYNQVPGSPIVLDLNSDGLAERAYIGDSDGRIWKFLFSDADPTNWKYCLFYDVTDLPGGTAAYDQEPGDEDDRQPIWYTPIVGLGPNNKYLIYFSTGHIETKAAASDEDHPNQLFAIVDDDDPNACTYAKNINAVYGLKTFPWPLELDPGEKLIDSPLLFQGDLVFKTYLPTTANACSPGTVRLWVINYLTGEAGMDFGGDDDRYIKDDNFGGVAIASDGDYYETPPGECTDEDDAANCCKDGKGFPPGACPCNRNDFEDEYQYNACYCEYCLCPGQPCPKFSKGLGIALPMSWGEGVSLFPTP